MNLLDHEAAWKAAITAKTGVPTLTYDETTSAPRFVRISVTRAARETPWACGTRRALGYRLTTLAVAENRSDVQELRHRIAGLQDRRLPEIQADRLAPDGESDDPTKDRDFLWNGFDSWLYVTPNPNH